MGEGIDEHLQSLTICVYQLGFESEVGTELVELCVLQRQIDEIGREGEGDAVFAGDFRGVEEEKFVDNACVEGGAIKRGPCF
jgi:hypothetical protein